MMSHLELGEGWHGHLFPSCLPQYVFSFCYKKSRSCGYSPDFLTSSEGTFSPTVVLVEMIINTLYL
jgi:hypothetical protein